MMGFCPPPIPTGDPARDRARFRQWLREREQEAIFQLARLLGCGVILGALAIGWFWSFLENAVGM